MAIGSAIQRGGLVFVYDERGMQITTIGAGSGTGKDGLTGYTSSTVSIRKGSLVFVYNERGMQISCHNG